MEAAIFAIANGLYTLNEAARRYSIPETTLRDHVARRNLIQRKAPRSYVKRDENPNLPRAVALVLEHGMSVGHSVRMTKVAKTTLRAELARRQKSFGRQPSGRKMQPERDVLQIPNLAYTVPPAYNAPPPQRPAAKGNALI